MNNLKKGMMGSLIFLVVVGGITVASAADVTVAQDIDGYFSLIDEVFTKIVDAGALRSTNLKQAERLFIREMRKNRSFFTFVRTNSKGMVISEVIRGEKVERPMRSVGGERWFKTANEQKETYYSLEKDTERGRYYLIWAKPVLKQGDRCVGVVLLKIDLWDSFYEFSNSVYYPFLIKLGNKTLFSHKWKKAKTGTEEQLTVPGISKISVVFEKTRQSPPETTVVAKADTSPGAVFSVGDSAKPEKVKKKGASGILMFFLVILILGITGASAMLIAWMRRRAFIRSIDEEEDR